MSAHRKETSQASSNSFLPSGFNPVVPGMMPVLGSPQKQSFSPPNLDLPGDFRLSSISPSLLSMWPSLALSYKFAMMSPTLPPAIGLPNAALNASLASLMANNSSVASPLLPPHPNLLPPPTSCHPQLEALYGLGNQASMPYPDLWFDFQRKCYLMLEELRRKEFEQNASPGENAFSFNSTSRRDESVNRKSPVDKKDNAESVFPKLPLNSLYNSTLQNSQYNFFPIQETQSKVSPSFPAPHSHTSSTTERETSGVFQYKKSSLTSSDCGSLDTLTSPSLPTRKNYSSISGMSFEQNRFKCSTCKRSYSTNTGLQKHREQHCQGESGKQYTCNHCAKVYHSMSALKMHIRTHTLPCKCSLCGKAFSRMWLLNGHIRTHTGEKPFSCQVCSRSFADRSNLRAHMQTHSEVKRYRCTKCEKTFSRMGLLTKHKASGCIRLTAVMVGNIKQELSPSFMKNSPCE